MRTSHIGHWTWLGMLLALPANGAPQTIQGPETHVSLFELYTSEGCNTCPPAEEWLSHLQTDPRLWKQLVPLAFHVDYWDYLGWHDPFDSHTYTQRQQAIAAQADSLAGRIIYTPQFVLDGKDWRDWFNDKPLEVDAAPKVGALSLSVDGRRLDARFSPDSPLDGPLTLYIAVLAFGVETRVGAGENQGAILRHDFLVVGYAHGGLTRGKQGYSAALSLPAVAVRAGRYALAAWVARADDPAPLQAAGGWLATAP